MQYFGLAFSFIFFAFSRLSNLSLLCETITMMKLVTSNASGIDEHSSFEDNSFYRNGISKDWNLLEVISTHSFLSVLHTDIHKKPQQYQFMLVVLTTFDMKIVIASPLFLPIDHGVTGLTPYTVFCPFTRMVTQWYNTAMTTDCTCCITV